MKYIRGIWSWLRNDKPDKLFTIILTLITAFGSSIGTSYYMKQDINLSSQTKTTQALTNVIADTPLENTVLAATDDNPSESSIKNFDSNDWIPSSNNFKPDREGYFCPNDVAFPSWYMWTKNKYKVDQNFSLTFLLLDKTNDEKNPTLYLSYGNKSNDIPEVFYRLNIFDGDLNTLRLYDRNEDDIQYERSKNAAILSEYTKFSLSPRLPNEKSSVLILNPLINISQKNSNANNQRHDFEPGKEFKINLPFPTADQGEGFQYGIGVSKNDCFKIISSSI